MQRRSVESLDDERIGERAHEGGARERRVAQGLEDGVDATQRAVVNGERADQRLDPVVAESESLELPRGEPCYIGSFQGTVASGGGERNGSHAVSKVALDRSRAPAPIHPQSGGCGMPDPVKPE